MKKYLSIILGALFVLGFAASAFAIHAEIPSETQAVVAAGGTQITLGGEIRTRGWYYSDIQIVGFTSPVTGVASGLYLPTKQVDPTNADTSFLDNRIRLSVDAKVTPNVEGYIQVESGSGQSDTWKWGNFNTMPSGISILQAWIMHSGSGLLGVPAGIKVGHMPLALGLGQFFDHTKFGDDAIVVFVLPTKEMEVDLLKIKFSNSLDTSLTSGSHPISIQTNNTDGYVAIFNYKIDDKNTIGINDTYLNNSFGDPLINSAGGQFTDNFKLNNLEITAQGNIEGFGYKFEADWQTGSVDVTPASGANTGTNNQKVDFAGYSALLALNYMVDPVNIRGSAAYGSGQKGIGSDTADTNINEFITFLGNDQRYTLIYEYNIATASLVNGAFNSAALSNGGRSTGLANTSYLNLGFDVKPIKDLTASIDGYYLYASNTSGWESLVGHSVSHQIGWEVDGRIVYDVAKNLKYQVDAGYFAAGQFYNDAFQNFTDPNINNASDVWLLRNSLTLSF